MDVSATLQQGVEILAPALTPHGFHFEFRGADKGSGGHFASGEFVRGDRRLALHFRHTLGLVTYHLGEDDVADEDFMRVVLRGARKNAYPGFSDDALGSFRHLRDDLEHFAAPFLTGSDAEFKAIVDEARLNPPPRGLRGLDRV
jgi:hypothetical protein